MELTGLLNLKMGKRTLDVGYIYILLMIIGSVMIFQLTGVFEKQIYKLLGLTTFLSYHILLEFASIVIFFTIFTITYYTYRKNFRLRLLIYFCVFFTVGWIDFFHTMSFQGMPIFFTVSSIPKATTFWMIGRLILSFGVLITSFIPHDHTVKLSRISYLWGSIIFTIIIFYAVTFRTEIFPPLFIEGVGLTPLKIQLEYLIMFVFGIASIFYLRTYERTKEHIFVLFAAGLIVYVFSEAAFTLYKSVYDNYNMLGHLYKIFGSLLLCRAIFVYHLDNPYKELKNARKQIKSYADNLERIVERRTAEIQRANEKMIEDLEYAKTIQQSLLPPKKLNIYGAKFISEYIPCERLSGDFYGMYMIDKEHIAMYIADVAGHGVSAAMMTVFADRVITPFDSFHNIKRSPSPSDTLTHFYKEFNKSEFPNEMHIVIFYAIYNTKTKVLSYCSGGMNSLPILIRKDGRVKLLDESIGFPICKFADFFMPEFETREIQLEEGDRIIFYTDGLVENFKDNTLLERETLINILKSTTNEPIDRVNQAIIKEIERITLDLRPDDDITYFIMEAS